MVEMNIALDDIRKQAPKSATHYDVSVFNQVIYFRYNKGVLQHKFRSRWINASNDNYVKPL